jgi:nucleoside-diphosphate-sugar epimerase
VNVLVAGGGGFVGSHLTEALLDDDHDVTVVDSFCTSSPNNLRSTRQNNNLTVIESDIIDRVPDGDFDCVVHLASRASPPNYQDHPVHTMRTNSEGTLRLLRVANTNDARVVYASTSEVYGDPDVNPQPESYNGNVSTTGPRACYDEAKRYGEALITSYARQHDVDYGIARIFNTYGPRLREDDGRAISTFISQALNGDDITVHGDGSQTRSFCYVDDLVRGLQALINYDEPVLCNLGNPDERTILETAEIINDLAGKKSSIVHEQRPRDDPERRKPDISRAKDVLGWQPRVSLEDGLKQTMQWYKQR